MVARRSDGRGEDARGQRNRSATFFTQPRFYHRAEYCITTEVESLRHTPFPHVAVSVSVCLSFLPFPPLSCVSHSTIYFQAEDIPTEPNEAADDVAAKAEAEKVSINSYAETVTFFIAHHGIRR